MTGPVERKSIGASARRWFERMTAGVRTLGVRVHPSPIIMLGNQKSGTTAIAALLSEMTGTPATLDLKKEMKEPVIDRIKSGSLTMAEFVELNKLDFSRSIIKEPSLSAFYEELAGYFPRATFVMVIRDPRDNIRSILNRLRIPGNLERLADNQMGEVTRAWELIIDGRWLGLDGGNYIEMLAQRWNFVTDSYLDNKDSIHLVRYEDFVANKLGVLESLARMVGLEPRHDVSHRVDVQFQPAGDKSVRWDDFFGPANLAAIERICGSRMAEIGYKTSH
jgi:hypothetical protein